MTEGEKANYLACSYYGEILTLIASGFLSLRIGIVKCLVGGIAVQALTSVLLPVATRYRYFKKNVIFTRCDGVASGLGATNLQLLLPGTTSSGPRPNKTKF
jgi:hypothetical protein